MADNYLEKRYEEVFGNGASHKGSFPSKPSLDSLLQKNRSCRGYDKSYVVHPLQLRAIVGVNQMTASAGNAQRLRFKLVTKGPEADLVLEHIRLGAALPELHLPSPGTEPEAFIVICSTVDENAMVDIDLGISLQSMSLKAAELGLACVIIRNFDREPIRQGLSLPFDPIAVLSVGKSAERIVIDKVREGNDLKYYRENGIHHVPKIILEDLIID